MPAHRSLGWQPFRSLRVDHARVRTVAAPVAPVVTRPVIRTMPRQRYTFAQGALLYCRRCERLRPHRSLRDRSGVECIRCNRHILTVEVVACYSADETRNPAFIMLPWRLLPPEIRAPILLPAAANEP